MEILARDFNELDGTCTKFRDATAKPKKDSRTIVGSGTSDNEPMFGIRPRRWGNDPPDRGEQVMRNCIEAQGGLLGREKRIDRSSRPLFNMMSDNLV